MQLLSDILHCDFLQYSIYAAFLASISCGVMGAYVVARRNSYMVGAVSHSLLGGIGLARYCQVVLGLSFLTPLHGAILASVLVSVLFTLLSSQSRFRADTVLSAIWTVGIAVGLCFIAIIPGYTEDLNSYLFGNILLISQKDLLNIAFLDLIIIPPVLLFQNRFLALCFHEEGLVLRGLSAFRTALLLNIFTGLAVVLLSQTVGVVMVLALMVLPAAAASRVTGRLPSIMLLAAVFCFISCLLGIVFSYTTDLPTGATIILVAAAIYAITAACTVNKK